MSALGPTQAKLFPSGSSSSPSSDLREEKHPRGRQGQGFAGWQGGLPSLLLQGLRSPPGVGLSQEPEASPQVQSHWEKASTWELNVL